MTISRRFQVEILPDVEWSDLLNRARHAEALGFDVVTTADQFVDWKSPTTPWFDGSAVLAGLAAATETIRLAHCVAQIPMRDPATFARQIATIDQISNGRAEVGLGLGLTVDPGYDMIGAPNWSNPERADRFGEYITIVDELLTTGHCTHHGPHYDVEAAAVHHTIQSPRPPITIAAMGPRMMRYAAAHADTWNTMSFGAGAEQLVADATRLKEKMTAACDGSDRDPATLRHSFLLFDADAREQAGRLFYWESTEAFADLAGSLFDLGFDEIGVYYPVEEQRATFESVAADAIPTLRR